MEEGGFLREATEEERWLLFKAFLRWFIRDFFWFIFRNPFAPHRPGGLQYALFGQGKEKKKRRDSNNDYNNDYGCYSSYHF